MPFVKWAEHPSAGTRRREPFQQLSPTTKAPLTLQICSGGSYTLPRQAFVRRLGGKKWETQVAPHPYGLQSLLGMSPTYLMSFIINCDPLNWPVAAEIGKDTLIAVTSQKAAGQLQKCHEREKPFLWDSFFPNVKFKTFVSAAESIWDR